MRKCYKKKSSHVLSVLNICKCTYKIEKKKRNTLKLKISRLKLAAAACEKGVVRLNRISRSHSTKYD